ncbi:unnamed protein product, partial [Allacma fusca]
MGGDFNCRNVIAVTVPEEILQGSWLSSERNARDLYVHSDADTLLNILEEGGLIILNGRTRGDEDGNFTFANEREASTIDFCAVGENVIHGIRRFEIVPVGNSDHFPILRMKISDEQKPLEEMFESFKCEIKNMAEKNGCLRQRIANKKWVNKP